MDSICPFSLYAFSKYSSLIMDYVSNKEKINIFPTLKKVGNQECGFLAFQSKQTKREVSVGKEKLFYCTLDKEYQNK